MTTIRVDFDQDRWLYLPESWPWDGFEGLDHKVAAVCDLLGPAHQLDAATTSWHCPAAWSPEISAPGFSTPAPRARRRAPDGV